MKTTCEKLIPLINESYIQKSEGDIILAGTVHVLEPFSSLYVNYLSFYKIYLKIITVKINNAQNNIIYIYIY